HAVDNLKEDIARVASSRLPKMVGKVSIVIGTANSPLIRKYIRQGVINGNDLKGKWEKYIIAACDTDIVIAGSDRRGCVYGIYELSRQLGVSPWYWWADIPVVRHDDIYIKKGVYTDGEPKVKYRGIFINDEN
ncbi:glycosyhydrolase, partial [Parabacteroides distasonis]